MFQQSNRYTIYADAYATFLLNMTWEDPADTPVDLTGYTAHMQVRPSIDSDVLTLDLTTENGYITLGGVLGTIALSVPLAAMGPVLPGTYEYDLELTSGSSVRTVLLYGEFIVNARVTRP